MFSNITLKSLPKKNYNTTWEKYPTAIKFHFQPKCQREHYNPHEGHEVSSIQDDGDIYAR